MKNKIDVTRQEFLDYEEIMIACVINMFDSKTVSQLSDLRLDVVREITKRYNEFFQKWPDVLKEART